MPLNSYKPNLVMMVSEEEFGECIEIPSENNGAVHLSTLMAQFPGACGLKYRSPDTGVLRGVKLIDDQLHAPEEGWVFDFFCVFSKGSKRKNEDKEASQKKQCTDVYNKCTDLIVLDLPYSATEKDLRDYFEIYGDVEMVQIKKDPVTRQSKGYGFIRFSDVTVQQFVLSTRHVIGERNCDVRIPQSKDPTNPYLGGKILVNRITEDFIEDDLRDYFSQYGEVTYVFIPRKPFKSLAFVQFLEPEASRQACSQSSHVIKNKTVVTSISRRKKGYDAIKSHQFDRSLKSLDDCSYNLRKHESANKFLINAIGYNCAKTETQPVASN